MVTGAILARLQQAALVAVALACVSAFPARPVAADPLSECFSDGAQDRVDACSTLLDLPGLDDNARSLAYSMRALAYSRNGQFNQALPDYDMAILLDPTSAMALNNRAWVRYKLSKLDESLADVEQSLTLSPGSPHAYDTRAHVHQARGEQTQALSDYEQAMRFGGENLVKLYQCGLTAHGLYSGAIDGLYTSDVRKGFEICVGDLTCDPLPPAEECQKLTS
jgi:tetratricopeptide (TPR) repeat protein